VLYDAAEDVEKAKAEEEGKPFPLAYAQVADALEKRGHKVKTIGITKKIHSLVALVEKDTSDVIFNLCEAIACSPQHEHNVVGLLELFEKCFTGCGSTGWMLAGDKALCKKVLQFHDIRYPRFCTFDKGAVEWSDDLEFPLIVKPLNEDASIGIDKGSVVYHVKELLERISYIQHEFDGAALVEEFIDGREIYVGVLGNHRLRVLPVWEMAFTKMPDTSWRIATERVKWSVKYQKRHGIDTAEAQLPEGVAQKIQHLAKRTYRALDLSGYARIDFRMDPTGKVYVIEANANPQLAEAEDFAQSAKRAKLSYAYLLERIMALGIEWQPHRMGLE
jgi:D-alanine-D-alanine ligase